MYLLLATLRWVWNDWLFSYLTHSLTHLAMWCLTLFWMAHVISWMDNFPSALASISLQVFFSSCCLSDPPLLWLLLLLSLSLLLFSLCLFLASCWSKNLFNLLSAEELLVPADDEEDRRSKPIRAQTKQNRARTVRDPITDILQLRRRILMSGCLCLVIG